MQRLVEDAGETCLVARSGDEGMVERVWSLVEDAGERCLVARSGDEGMVERVWSWRVWLVYPPVTRVTRVQFPDGKLLFAPTCSHLLFCSHLLPPALLLFCSSALLLFCFAFLCCSLSCRSRTTTDISHATNAQLAHRHLCCCRIGLTNADEDRHVHGAVLVVRASLHAPSRCVVVLCSGAVQWCCVAVLCVSWTHGGTVDVTRMQRLVRYDWSRMREKRVWWRGVATRWLVYPPVTRVTRVQFPDGKLLFAPTCSSALLLFCSSALLPPPTLLLFCSSAPTYSCSSALLLFCSSALLPPPTLLLFCSSALLLFCSSAPTYSSALLLFCFAFLCRFLSCRSRTTTDISHATNAQLAHRHLCCCRIGLTNADEDRHVHGAVLVLAHRRVVLHLCCCRIGLTNADEDRHVHGAVLVIGRGCGRNVFGGAEWRRGYGRARVVVCVGGGRSWLVYPPVTRVTRVQFPDGKLLFAPTCSSALLPPPTLLLFCSSALLLFCSSALLFFAAFFPAVRAPQPTSLMLPTHSWRIGTSAAVESDSPTRTKIDTCTAPYSSLVEDAGERCLVARSGDEGMVERWLVYPPVTRVTRVQFPDGKLLFAPTYSSALLLFCSSALLLFCSSAPTYSSALLLFCSSAPTYSSALLLFCFAFLCRFLSWRTTTDISHATNAQLAHRHLCCCRIGLTNADEDRHVYGAVLVIGRGCGRKVFGGAEWRRGYGRARVVVCVGGGRSWLVYPPVTRVTRVQFPDGKLLFAPTYSSALLLPPALLLFCSSALLPPPTLLLFCSSALLFFAAFFPAVRAPQPTSLMLPTHSWRIGTSAAVESDSPTRTKIDTCTAPYSSLVEDAGETCLVARSGDEGMVERVWSLVEDAGETCLVARSGDEGMVERVWSLVEDAGETCLVARSGDEGMVERVWSSSFFAPTCSSALLLFCSSALLPPPTLLLFCSSALLFFAAFFPAVRAPQPTSLMLPTHSWRIGTSAAVESDSPTRTKIDTCTAPYSSLVEDAGETCLVARSGDEGMSWLVYPPVTRVTRVQFPDGKLLFAPTCSSALLLFCSHLLFCSSALLLFCPHLLFCSSALLLCFSLPLSFLPFAHHNRHLSCYQRTAGASAPLLLCCVAVSVIGLTNADEDRHVHGAVLVIGRGCGRNVFGGAEWRRGILFSICG
ncbi:hypothetical protein P3T76_016418 [Phytophthora citrophthora]|uniref:Uncharacterized protein n=1 Tax=Phytophthora citrophthora TaxID=4793 RepID=A0AAD9LAE2_9STRA|nr:hypothetical protein P3T76_016418 [Phytophthora citrophthora]